MANAFPSSFMEPLLRMSLIKDAGIRRIVQEILHTLIDRHDNLSKLKTVGSEMLEFFITVILRLCAVTCCHSQLCNDVLKFPKSELPWAMHILEMNNFFMRNS